MAKMAGRTRPRPGLVGRTARGTVRLGMLATAVFLGRMTASGGGAKDDQETKAGRSQGSTSQGLGAAAGDGQSAGQETDPDTATDTERGRTADTPTEIPARGWLAIAKRTMKEVKADQVPLLAAGVAFYALLSLFPAIIAGVSI